MFFGLIDGQDREQAVLEVRSFCSTAFADGARAGPFRGMVQTGVTFFRSESTDIIDVTQYTQITYGDVFRRRSGRFKPGNTFSAGDHWAYCRNSIFASYLWRRFSSPARQKLLPAFEPCAFRRYLNRRNSINGNDLQTIFCNWTKKRIDT